MKRYFPFFCSFLKRSEFVRTVCSYHVGNRISEDDVMMIVSLLSEKSGAFLRVRDRSFWLHVWSLTADRCLLMGVEVKRFCLFSLISFLELVSSESSSTEDRSSEECLGEMPSCLSSLPLQVSSLLSSWDEGKSFCVFPLWILVLFLHTLW